MSKKEDILIEYFYNQSIFLKQDIDQLQENIRYRNISDVDCFELIIAIARYTAFLDFSREVKHILGLNHKSPKQ